MHPDPLAMGESMDDTPYQLTRLQLCAQDCPSHLVVVGIQVQVRGAAILLSVVRSEAGDYE